jgi:hypothetical protein
VVRSGLAVCTPLLPLLICNPCCCLQDSDSADEAQDAAEAAAAAAAAAGHNRKRARSCDDSVCDMQGAAACRQRLGHDLANDGDCAVLIVDG